MNPLTLRPILVLSVLMLAGCQTPPPEVFEAVYPFYAAKAEAQAVAAGKFGAVPLEMPGEADIELLGVVACESGVAELRSRAGRSGWIPLSALPHRLLISSGCGGETARIQS